MKICKYVKKYNDIYEVIFENNKKLLLCDDIILKYNLLYRSDIEEELYDKLIQDNNKYLIYNKCIRYIGIRLRSILEVKVYLDKFMIDEESKKWIIDRLISNKLLDDEKFIVAFINDKLRFTNMGPLKIRRELYKYGIDSYIIDKYINNIDDEIIISKIDREIDRYKDKYKDNVRNRIYNRLVSNGFKSDIVISRLNLVNF